MGWYGFSLAWHETRCRDILMAALVDRSKSSRGRARKTKAEILQALAMENYQKEKDDIDTSNRARAKAQYGR
jgi:hypothetical protein